MIWWWRYMLCVLNKLMIKTKTSHLDNKRRLSEREDVLLFRLHYLEIPLRQIILGQKNFYYVVWCFLTLHPVFLLNSVSFRLCFINSCCLTPAQLTRTSHMEMLRMLDNMIPTFLQIMLLLHTNMDTFNNDTHSKL